MALQQRRAGVPPQRRPGARARLARRGSGARHADRRPRAAGRSAERPAAGLPGRSRSADRPVAAPGGRVRAVGADPVVVDDHAACSGLASGPASGGAGREGGERGLRVVPGRGAPPRPRAVARPGRRLGGLGLRRVLPRDAEADAALRGGSRRCTAVDQGRADRALDLPPVVRRAGRGPGAGPTRSSYAADRVRIAAADVVAWPPARNDRCWCGSGRKYKQCCGSVRLAPDGL